MIIAITGTPCTGKTTISRILARKLGWRLVELTVLATEKKLFCGFDRKRKARIVDVERVGKAVLGMEGNLVIESHYAHDLPNSLTVVLRCEIKALKKRMEQKGWKKAKIQENLQAEIFDVCGEEARELLGRKVLEVDTTRKTPEAVAREIRAAMGKKKPKKA